MGLKLEIKTQGGSALRAKERVMFESEDWSDESICRLACLLKALLVKTRPLCLNIRLNITDSKENPIDTHLLLQQIQASSARVKNYKLTPREQQVLALIMEGYTNREMADKMCVCPETIKSHRKHILKKTGCRNMAMLIGLYSQVF